MGGQFWTTRGGAYLKRHGGYSAVSAGVPLTNESVWSSSPARTGLCTRAIAMASSMAIMPVSVPQAHFMRARPVRLVRA